MAKKKTIVPEVVETTEATEPEVSEVETKEVVKSEKETEKKVEKSKVLSSKKEICEFYWIRDEQILDDWFDLSKFNMAESELEVVTNWAAEKKFSISHEIDIDIYACPETIRNIINKYGLSVHNIACGKLDELNEEEKESIVSYYNELVKAEMAKRI